MRYSAIALLGLSAIASRFGVDARALPARDGALSTFSLSTRESEFYASDRIKRGIIPTIPRPVTVPRPVTEPRPLEPVPVIHPNPVVNPRPGCAKSKRGGLLFDRAPCTLTTDQVPQVNEIMDEIDNPTGKYMFYSGPGGYHSKANDWINKQNRGTDDAKKGYKKLDQSWKTVGYDDTYGRNQPEEVAALFNNRASEAFAKKSQGVVYVIMEKGKEAEKDWYELSVWVKFEWPSLKANTAVTKVIVVNPVDDAEVVIKGT